MKCPSRGKGWSLTSRFRGSSPAPDLGLPQTPSPAWKRTSTRPALSWAGLPRGAPGAKAIVKPARGVWGYWLVTLWVCVTFTPPELVLFPWGSKSTGCSLCCVKAPFLSASELTCHPGIAHFEARCTRQKKKKKIEGTVSA